MKNDFMQAWDTAWNMLYSASPILLMTSLICLFGAGTLTWYGLTYEGLAEKNILLHPLFSMFGVSSVLLFDALTTAVMLIFYKLTRRKSLKYIHIITLFMFYFAMMFDFFGDLIIAIKI
jgi:hypothetical protein